jgi:hypothetical protein
MWSEIRSSLTARVGRLRAIQHMQLLGSQQPPMLLHQGIGSLTAVHRSTWIPFDITTALFGTSSRHFPGQV